MERLRRLFIACSVLSLGPVLSGCGGGLGTGTNTVPAATWYLHFTCGTSSQCAADFGASLGIQATFASQQACQNQVSTFAGNNTIQPYTSSVGIGDWCSTSNNPNDAHP